MAIKIHQILLALGLTSMLASCASDAATPQNKWLAQAQFLQPIHSKLSHDKTIAHGQLIVSESLGIALLDAKGNVKSVISRKAEHLDFRFSNDTEDHGIISTIDVNTGEVLFIAVDFRTGTLSLKQTYKPDQAAFEAICLSKSSQGLDMFAISALGDASHLNVYQRDKQGFQIRPINQFAVGPNVKSCAVDERTDSLFITEENIGVWRYSTNPEHEIMRELLALPIGLEVEYVDTTTDGDVAVVSPGIDQLWILNHINNQFEPLPLVTGMAPKSVQLARTGDVLVAHMFDDEKEVMTSATFTKAIPPENGVERSVSSLPPFAQTTPVKAFGDAADDPAIWVNNAKPKNSLVYGTDKKHGLNVYDLNGQLLKNLPVGRVNNVDIRYGIDVQGKTIDLAAASNRTNKSISLFAIDTNTGLPSLLAEVKTDLDDPYGLCLSQLESGVSVWINDTNGRFQRYQLSFDGQSVSGTKTEEWRVPSQPEGCVSDDTNKRLYYGEEATGVWLKHIDSSQEDQFITGLNPEIAADIEGIGLYQLHGQNYLVVSSQGNNRYAVYKTNHTFDYLGAFEIGANWSAYIDGASETDGLEVTSLSLGKALPNGLMVVQDGRNVMPRQPQNFKLVDGSLLKLWIESKL